jgi:hypothetical protein
MRIGGKKPYSGVFERIGLATLRPSLTSEIRSEFLKLPFRDQAELIGWHARKALKTADRMISKSIISASGGEPRAIDIWEKMVGKAPGIECKKIFSQSDILKIEKLYPGLTTDVTRQIARLFDDTITYWVKNFYSCNRNGRADFYACQWSRARTFNDEEMRQIDSKSGMPYLGWNIQNYADLLFHVRFYKRYIQNDASLFNPVKPLPSYKRN